MRIKKPTITLFLIILLCLSCPTTFALAHNRSVHNPPHATTFFHVTPKSGDSFNSLATSFPAGLAPIQIRSVYNLPSIGGNGTIAIIDAYDDPTVLSDLQVFSQQFNLPSPNLEIHKMSSPLQANSNWALEISLDVQWAHAIAPNAKILLVEASSDLFSDLLSAVSYATSRSDVIAVSMSWGGSEFIGETSYDQYFTSSNGIIFFASSGDSGSGVIWPSCSPNVISVGGTTLSLNSNGTLVTETAWSGSGGGLSTFETEPAYQATYGLSMTNGKRAVPDVSYNAAPTSGFSVYDTTPYSGQTGWFIVGGTSAGSPQWAAIQALGMSITSSNLYQDARNAHASYFRDITSGSNGAYTATTGYDLVTGLGSPITCNFETKTFPLKGFSVINGGSGYTTPTVIISGGLGSGATATARVSNGVVYRVDLLSGGVGYTSQPTVSLIDPSPKAKDVLVSAIIG